MNSVWCAGYVAVLRVLFRGRRGVGGWWLEPEAGGMRVGGRWMMDDVFFCRRHHNWVGNPNPIHASCVVCLLL